MEEKNLKCNMCNGNMKHIEYNGTHIWSCEECPNVQFEFIDINNYIELGNYLKNNNEIKEKIIAGMSYEEFKKETIENFKKYLEEETIKEAEIKEDDIYNYFSCMHFDFMAELESIEDLQYIENIIENILKEEYKIKEQKGE